jgi:hypothetical protein
MPLSVSEMSLYYQQLKEWYLLKSDKSFSNEKPDNNVALFYLKIITLL